MHRLHGEGGYFIDLQLVNYKSKIYNLIVSKKKFTFILFKNYFQYLNILLQGSKAYFIQDAFNHGKYVISRLKI